MNNPTLKYELPNEFYNFIKPYIAERRPKVIEDRKELIRLWQKSLESRIKNPELKESIAEWTVSAAASSLLIDNNDTLEAIHSTFGLLEINDKDNDKYWDKLAQMIQEAAEQ